MVQVSVAALRASDPAYVPGLPREHVAERFGIELEDVAKLGSAENPFGPSPKAVAAIESGKARIDLYPEWSSRLLREAIAAKYGFEADCVVCGSGETEIISLFLRAFAGPGDAVLMHEPCFPIYHIFAENEGRVPVYVGMGEDFDLVVDRYIAKLTAVKPRIAFITNPHSPSGRLMSEADIRRICEAGRETLIALDEAYIHYTETPGAMHLTRDYDNLIVLRTFSKAYGLAGLCLGFGVAAYKECITQFRNLKPT